MSINTFLNSLETYIDARVALDKIDVIPASRREREARNDAQTRSDNAREDLVSELEVLLK